LPPSDVAEGYRAMGERRAIKTMLRVQSGGQTMPHVIVKLWPGKSEHQKQKLAEGVTQVVMSSLGYGEESVSVSFEEIASGDWTEKVYKSRHPQRPRQALQAAGL
jgi:4-oxalocrotonate tautomerase